MYFSYGSSLKRNSEIFKSSDISNFFSYTEIFFYEQAYSCFWNCFLKFASFFFYYILYILYLALN